MPDGSCFHWKCCWIPNLSQCCPKFPDSPKFEPLIWFSSVPPPSPRGWGVACVQCPILYVSNRCLWLSGLEPVCICQHGPDISVIPKWKFGPTRGDQWVWRRQRKHNCPTSWLGRTDFLFLRVMRANHSDTGSSPWGNSDLTIICILLFLHCLLLAKCQHCCFVSSVCVCVCKGIYVWGLRWSHL